MSGKNTEIPVTYSIVIKRTNGGVLELCLNEEEMSALYNAVTSAPVGTCQCWHCRAAHAPGAQPSTKGK